MARTGRRPGESQARESILEAARREFDEQGYNAATIRSIARRADVDPALVYHYFGEKSALFTASVSLPTDPRRVKLAASEQGGGGAAIVERFLAQWEQPGSPRGQAFRTVSGAMVGSPEAARNMREFLTERVWGPRPPDIGAADWSRRNALVSSQLVGLAWARYVLKVEPLASASRRAVGRWAGPTIDRYLAGAGPDTAPASRPVQNGASPRRRTSDSSRATAERRRSSGRSKPT